jgi:hypothetical protein
MDAPSQDILAEEFAHFEAVWPEEMSVDEEFHPELFGVSFVDDASFEIARQLSSARLAVSS